MNRQEFETAIATKSGSSGQTMYFALAYLKRFMPAIVLLENVAGLSTGYYIRTKQGEQLTDLHSNLGVLLSCLHELGCPTFTINTFLQVCVKLDGSVFLLGGIQIQTNANGCVFYDAHVVTLCVVLTA